jgi:hypothetical protein
MSKKDLAALPPPIAFLLLWEVAARWRRSPITTQRLLRKFGVPVHRLTSRDHLYALSDIEAIEKASRLVGPKPARNCENLLVSKRKELARK